ncbi:MAG: sulfite exporter TauE/SafE family protein [bacterium]|nr:sulfite exporter TauE/SafE family protein [bacterium]
MWTVDLLRAVLAIVAIAVTHWLGGVTAFGSTLLAFPVLVWLIDLRSTRTILLLIGTIQAYQVFAYTYRGIDWRQFGRMALLAGLGLPVGMLAVRHLPEKPLLAFLGGVLVASGVSRLRAGSAAHSRGWPAPILDGLLVLGGIIHGAFISGGAALVVYAQHRLPEKEAFRGTLSMFWVAMNTILVGSFFLGDDHTRLALPILISAIPVAIGVSWLGNRTAGRLSQAAFTRLVAWLLIVGGVTTAVRMLF